MFWRASWTMAYVSNWRRWTKEAGLKGHQIGRVQWCGPYSQLTVLETSGGK